MKASVLVRLIALVMAIMMIVPLALASCNAAPPSNQPEENACAHVDDNNTGYCDICNAKMPETENGGTENGGTENGGTENGGTENGGEPEEYTTITVAEAIALCGTQSGYITTERYYIRATVKNVTNAAYGAMVIEDETGSISVYGMYSADGEIGYANFEYKPVKGDEVLVHCILQNFNGKPEIQNARLIEYVNNQGNIDVSAYTEATISEARAAEVGANLKVTGVVARITYANGMKPSGFILVDGGASIYVYDADAAQRVAIGNTVTIAGTKDMWILDSEQNNAAAYGYKGCNQLTSCILVSNDEKTSAPDYSWVEEATVKELIENPVTNDITTKIYKVTARVNKVPGNGFTNYYINDLDYIDAEHTGTGSYVYTQCNGGDFAWLDAFDGKVCTVYVVVLNAKSTASGCVYRFLPVEVKDEGFVFDTTKAAQHAVKYYGVGQFFASYTADPSLELVTSVSSAPLGFEGVTLTYVSSNTSVISFATEEGKTVMHVVGSGTVKVTVTATYNGTTYSEDVEITAETSQTINSITVAEAIAAENGTEVTVKGIVGPGLANQKGFYLIDESGIIPIRINVDDLALVKMGDEIVVKGTRTITKDGGGQICIDSCTLEQNNFGNHEIVIPGLITDKTMADVKAVVDDPANTLLIYKVTAKIERSETQYSANTYVVDGDYELMLYSGGKGDYAWLEDYLTKDEDSGALVSGDLTITVALCDWNAKGIKGCVLSIELADGTVVYNTNVFSK